MKSVVACLAAFLAVPSAYGAILGVNTKHPVEKVIGMLEGLIKTVNKEAQEEEHLYGKFTYWCRNSQKELNKVIAEEKEKIEELSDTIASKKEEIKALSTQIDELVEQIKELDLQDAEAKKLRTKEENLYKHTAKELGETIEAIAEATQKLEEAQKNTDSFVQAQAQVRGILGLVQAKATEEESSILSDFVAQGPDLKDRPDFKAAGDRAAHVKKYAFKSQKVIELLKQLEAKFAEDELAVVKAETNAVNAYQLAKSAREDERTAANKAKDAKEEEKDEAIKTKKKAEGELTSTQADLKADTELLADTEKKCDVKAQQWEERSRVRSLELEAMNKAIEIMSKVTGVRTEAPENPVPPPSPIKDEADRLSFLQFASSDPRQRAMELIRAAAKRTKSKALAQVAQEMQAHLGGPFDEVNGMIQKMIFHLMAEQKDEDDHKNWCDLELNKTDASIVDKEEKIEELQAKISEAQAYVTELTKEITENTEMVAKIEMHMKESAEIREVGKKENAEAVKDAQDAQAAIAEAVAVLETHYKETGMIDKESWEFVQRHEDPAKLPKTPSTWDASYTGVTDPKEADKGIIAVLEKVSADFATMESDTKVQEETDEQFYKEEMSQCEIEKATRLKDAEVKGEEKKRQVAEIEVLEGEKKHNEDELHATRQYLSDLQKDILKDAFEKPPANVSMINKAKSLRGLGRRTSLAPARDHNPRHEDPGGK